ncbi:MAG: hypothetical protein IJD35_07715 [Clostridia bacterium]|nr:hypothetical protein [Clostridia bacterium]
MFRYHWSRLRIELHVKTFEGISEEKITQYFFSPSELETEPTVSIAGKGILDYVLTVQMMSESEVVLFDAMRSEDEMLNLDCYESKGVLILHEGDIHKTPTINISYNKSYWYEVSIE